MGVQKKNTFSHKTSKQGQKISSSHKLSSDDSCAAVVGSERLRVDDGDVDERISSMSMAMSMSMTIAIVIASMLARARAVD